MYAIAQRLKDDNKWLGPFFPEIACILIPETYFVFYNYDAIP